MTNRPNLDDVLNGADLTSLPLDVMALLIEDAKALKSKGDHVGKIVMGALTARYEPKIDGAFQAAQKDTGTVHVDVGDGFEIEANRTKKVDWDQTKLAAVGDKISEAGDDPHEYISATYTVDERKFTAWPEHIRAVFEPARTLKPGSLTIKLKMKEAA